MMVAPVETPTREDLCEQVVRAFSSRPYPGDDAIAEHDERYPDYEGDQVSAFLRGKSWRDVTFESLRDDYPGDQSACLHFMTADGFRYYLPAFLLMALDPHARDMAEHVTFVLTDPGDAEATRHERFRARVTSLLPAEKIAVTEVLRLMARECEEGGDPINPAREALDSYWEPAAARA